MVFIHVPKAAGSTVNAHLARWSSDGLDHAERYADQPDKISRMIPRLDWISGHLALNRMLSLIGPTERELKIYGTMRPPMHHAAAQYNWQIEIFHRGARKYRAHSEPIRELSERIRASDNGDAQVVIDNIMFRRGLFLNIQSRFLLGDDIVPNCKEPPASERLSMYHKVALPWEVDTMLEEITGLPPAARQENVSRRHFDRGIFQRGEVREFLLKKSRFDFRLFWHLKDQAAPEPERD